MNDVSLTNQEIELVFNNCECINIDMWAIENLQFEVESEQFIWDKHHKNLMKQYVLKDFYLKVNCAEKVHFHHTTRLVPTWGQTDSIFTDGEKCIERLLNSNDLCHVYINGICYRMPWKDKAVKASLCGSPITDYVNAWHSASEIKNNSNERFIEIKIKKEENPSCYVREDYSQELKADMEKIHGKDSWEGDNPGGCFG